MSPPTESPKADRGADAPASGGPQDSETEPPTQAFAEAIRRLGELRSYFTYYVASQIDRIRLTIRGLVLLAAFAVLGLVTVAAIVTMGVVQVLGGIAGAIAQLIPSHPWIGGLVTGLLALIAVAAALWWGLGVVRRASRSAIRAKYEAWKSRQREQFGRSVDDRSS